VGHGCQLGAHFGKRHAGADIRDRSNLDGPYETLEHIVKQLDLRGIQTVGGQQEKICDALDRIQALFRRAGSYRRFDFVDD
jgi:hypothetical protein